MLTLAQVLAKFPQAVLDKYSFDTAQYTGALDPIENVICPQHGAFRQYAAQFRKGRGCPSCGAVQRVTSIRTPAEEYFSKVKDIHNGKYDYTNSVFTKMNAKIDVKCPEHGVFSISANHHYYRKQGCGTCEAEDKKVRIVKYRHLSAQAKIDNTAKVFFNNCTLTHDGKYTYPEQDYPGAKFKIRVICPVHGEFQQAAWSHLSGVGCPSCGAYTPAWETELKKFLEGLGFIPTMSAPVLGGREIDLYLQDLRFGVELHGLRWHTTRTRDKDYHRTKWETAEKAGIRLIQIFEDEWHDKKQIILDRLSAMLGCGQRFDARKCTVEILETAQAKDFLNRTHTQGAGAASLYYGLRFQGEIVAVASFGKARTGGMTSVTNDGSWEVIRYASIGRVRGGFGRLFKRFLGDVSPTLVISYCDLRYGDGKLYQATDFVLDGVTEPDYWWVPNGKIERIPRYVTQKHKIKDHPVLGAFYSPDKTEAQVCADAGWERIYGVGHQRWVWKA